MGYSYQDKNIDIEFDNHYINYYINKYQYEYNNINKYDDQK